MSEYTLREASDFARTLHIPMIDLQLNVPDNSWVVLAFELTPSERASAPEGVMGERMFVQVNNRESDQGTYYGTLGDSPAYCKGVKIGDPIQFEAKQILDIVSSD